MAKTGLRRFVFIGFIMIFAITIFSCKNSINKNKGIFVTQWNNIYEGKNIKFYYEDSKSTYMQNLNTKYDLDNKVKDSKDDLEKSLKIKEWIHTLLQYNKGTFLGKEDAIDILEATKDSKKASDRDFAIVYSEALTSIGVYSRIGEFRTKEGQFQKEGSLYICEVWNEAQKKWIAIDIANDCYYEGKDGFLSAAEIVDKGLGEAKIIGVKDAKKYISKNNKFFYSYTVSIDNTKAINKKSNSFITYIPTNTLPEIKVLNKYVEPTIFVNKLDMFKVSPKMEYKDDKSDALATLILMKKDPKEDKDGNLNFVLGAFKDSAMIKEYYVSINGSEMSKVSKYIDVVIREGKNVMSLSEDGKTIVREIIMEYKK